MGHFEALEEKKFDVRVLERARLIGKLDKKNHDLHEKSIQEDVSAMATYSNYDELNARDNPVHIPRGLPSLEAPVRKNLEDMEFDTEDAARGGSNNFEQ